MHKARIALQTIRMVQLEGTNRGSAVWLRAVVGYPAVRRTHDRCHPLLSLKLSAVCSSVTKGSSISFILADKMTELAGSECPGVSAIEQIQFIWSQRKARRRVLEHEHAIIELIQFRTAANQYNSSAQVE